MARPEQLDSHLEGVRPLSKEICTITSSHANHDGSIPAFQSHTTDIVSLCCLLVA